MKALKCATCFRIVFRHHLSANILNACESNLQYMLYALFLVLVLISFISQLNSGTKEIKILKPLKY